MNLETLTVDEMFVGKTYLYVILNTQRSPWEWLNLYRITILSEPDANGCVNVHATHYRGFREGEETVRLQDMGCLSNQRNNFHRVFADNPENETVLSELVRRGAVREYFTTIQVPDISGAVSRLQEEYNHRPAAIIIGNSVLY